MQVSQADFGVFAAPLIGLPVSHVWNGAGSAMFVEFGRLTPRTRRDGSPGSPQGEMTLMIEWSWRIEGRRSILCGSWSDERRWNRVWAAMIGRTVTEAKLFGRLPEIEIALSGGVHVLSFATETGLPQWTLFDKRRDKERWISYERGGLAIHAPEG